MKQLVWSPSSINFGSKKKGESATAESTLSITEGSVLLTPGKISPVPGTGYPVQLKNTEGSLHIHPAFSFAAARYYLTSEGVLTTNRDLAEIYLGNASAGAGLPFLPVPITLVITTPPGDFDPADPITINYTRSGLLWVKAYYRINDDPDWIFYDSYNAVGTLEMDLSEVPFSHGDILHIKVQDDESTSFYDTVDLTAMVATITIDSINNGDPLTYEGLFEDGMWYFADTTGTKVVDQNDPDRSEWFIGTGNADGDIDLDIKMLAITDVVVPETVQLGVAFDVSGNYVMLEPRIVIEAFDGVTWKKIHAGDYIDVTGGSFTETVTIKSADGFTVNTTVTVRVRSYDGYALNGSDSTDIIATVTMNAITGMVDGTPYTLEGTTDGDSVEIWVDDGTGYAKEGDAVVVGSAWSYDITLAVGTYGIKAIDGTDSRGYAEQTGVDILVASYVKILSILDDGIFVEIQNKKTII